MSNSEPHYQKDIALQTYTTFNMQKLMFTKINKNNQTPFLKLFTSRQTIIPQSFYLSYIARFKFL